MCRIYFGVFLEPQEKSWGFFLTSSMLSLFLMDNKISSDQWIKCISTQGNIRGVAINATELVQTIADRHLLQGSMIQALGETVMGALLVASYCKPGERVNLNVRGSGLVKQALADAYPEGTVRGYVIENQTPVHSKEETGPWGSGLLSILKTRDEEAGKPYIGTVPLITGFLPKDLSFYWAQSEQIPSAVGLAVNFEGNKVISAGGFLVQALPGASPLEVQTIEQHIHEIQSLASSFATDGDPLHLLSQIFQSTAFVIIDKKPVTFKCNCSWERVERALVLIGAQELQDILTQNKEIIVRCDFCAHEYQVSLSELKRLIKVTQQSADQTTHN